MILETQRLIIEEATIDDVAFFFELLNSPNWLEHIGDRGIKNESDAINYIENSLIQSYATHGYGLYKMVLKESNTPIGICGFLQRDYLDNVDIGFAILPGYERKGYTFEAADQMMNYGKSQLGFQQIYAITTNANVGSQKLLEKIGLKYIRDVNPDENSTLMLFALN